MDRFEDGGWQSWPISIAVHVGYIVKALEEAGLKTMGELAAFTNSGRTLTSIDGIGEATEAKLVEQLQLFWDANPGIDSNECAPEDDSDGKE